MFLEKVGITNSFNDDVEHRFKPFFEVNGIQFAHIKKKELYFVVSSLNRDLSPSIALELLENIVHRIHDFCGGIEEELLRTNFVLIYELIDEMIDFGFI
jgi:AP-4 complex subunit mu-1